ncbi:thiol-disulfide isomerase/thioredoxin [Melghiribacillus thermohalophilus]|uniref:Thiol-disulfide isomerase/thioredoxin n=1 Tax=Melghiribacillus thermohalophilus TaxID=1324956 RepID=A0A4R3N752_9BACI|nr:thioredoxin family protein [Melghiribacillus thermohalophilus]TCT25098.1 thiol-disulfide isomerase/thioredoxin [Melghiribacillus thermohalophilus]
MNFVRDFKEITQTIEEQPLTLLYVSQPHCSVCHSVLPQVREVLKDYPKVKGIHADASETPAVSGAYLVFTVPVIILFSKGKELHRQARFIQLDKLIRQLNILTE